MGETKPKAGGSYIHVFFAIPIVKFQKLLSMLYTENHPHYSLVINIYWTYTVVVVIILMLIILQFLAKMEMLGYTDLQLKELELFMSVSMVHGEKCVEENIIQGLPLLSVHNLATHPMV